MINVVFLLLIFFLIAARLTPPEAFAVTPPRAPGTEAVGDFTLLMAPDGALAFGALRGRTAALTALSAARDVVCRNRDCDAQPPSLTLRADAAAPAKALAALLPDLSAMGFARIDLATVPQ